MAKIAVEREENLKKGRITHGILRVLRERPLQIPGYRGASLSAAFLPKLEEHGIGRKRRNNIRIAIDRLRRLRCIEHNVGDDRNTLRITSAGEKRLRQYDMENLALKTFPRWDGLWRIVMFDIPEDKKRARDAISRKLKQLGFYQLQKSVSCHYVDCQSEVEFIEDYLGINGLITYVEARSLGASEQLVRRFFKLK
ncbi:MAG: hypothetical protein HYT40_03560 [Candidatus Sungbacteria bacterium]|uniref:Transcriptional repressor PaaX-like central Cas2-like domain-containing protein n=1 Tax=Candidatus Sungiibacteriota bacterium TaxID=2750080 RepID=A0A931SC41_9BACT|nr:hypothetical protein [Candidatus Sungbacteria bacterium]